MCVFYKNYAVGLYLLHNFKKSIHKIYACTNLIHNLLNQISNYIKLIRKFWKSLFNFWNRFCNFKKHLYKLNNHLHFFKKQANRFSGVPVLRDFCIFLFENQGFSTVKCGFYKSYTPESASSVPVAVPVGCWWKDILYTWIEPPIHNYHAYKPI